jgi:antitoxin ParD1/3/4
MSTVRKMITLTVEQDGWIQTQIDAGKCVDDSEYIRDLIQREQERSAEIDAIRCELIEGEESGAPNTFDVAAFKERMRGGRG